MSSYDGLQVVQDHGLHEYYEPPIPIEQISYEKGPQIGVGSGDRTPSGKILGMQRRTFWLVAIVVIVIVAATVGGGVGGSLANKKTSSRQAITQSSGSATLSTPPQIPTTSSSSTLSPSIPISTTSQTSSTSSTSTVSSSTPTPTSGYTGCPGIDGTLFTASSGAKFMQYCNYELENSINIDTDPPATQNLDDCINLCDATNARQGSTACTALTYDFAGIDFLLCWLKNATGTLELDELANTIGNYSVAAILQ